MNPHELLATAHILLASEDGNPTNTSLRRVVSSAYYALFHCLAEACADLIAGHDRGGSGWRQVYRSLDHGLVRSRCRQKESIGQFPEEIQLFASWFVDAQVKRHDADYDPDATFTKPDVAGELVAIESAIDAFEGVGDRDKRAFCIFVLLKDRRS